MTANNVEELIDEIDDITMEIGHPYNQLDDMILDFSDRLNWFELEQALSTESDDEDEQIEILRSKVESLLTDFDWIQETLANLRDDALHTRELLDIL